MTQSDALNTKTTFSPIKNQFLISNLLRQKLR